MPARTSLLVAALAGVVLQRPAVPAAAATCRPGHGQEVAARSAQAVVLRTTAAASRDRLWGCSRRTGTRRLLAAGGRDDELRSPVLLGTQVGYVHVPAADRPHADVTVVRDDAVRRGRRRAVGFRGDAERLDSLRIGTGGALAWRTTRWVQQRLLMWRPGDTARLVDEGFQLSGARFSGRTLRWRHDDVDRSVGPPAASACTGRPEPGSTMTVDIVRSTTTVACLRATGASTSFVALPEVVSAGSWVAVAEGGTIEVRNLRDPTAARTLTGLHRVDGLVVDEHGAIAWTPETDDGGHDPNSRAALWTDGADGTRAFGTCWGWNVVRLARDGSVVRWAVGPGEDAGGTAVLPSAG